MSETRASLAALETASALVHSVFPGTPAYRWPLLEARLGTELWIKHENHTPVGAFKLRGGLVFLNDLARAPNPPRGVITATRGNHGQSIATAGRRFGIAATIVVPEGNSAEKNAAMQAQGADLRVFGHDFQAAADHAKELAVAEGLMMLPSFHPLLVQGTGTYALEFFRAAGPLDVVYVPIGLGSGICGMISARDALGLTTQIVGVVAEGAPSYKLSFDAGRPVSTERAETLADGMACRVPVAEAVELINSGAARIVSVNDDQIAEAMRILFRDTHNVAEGAGAAALAAVLADRDRLAGRRVGAVLSGGNVDTALYARVLEGTL